MTELTFIIPCHNTENTGYIIPCVESIRKTNPEADILVIDSASPDKSYIKNVDAQVLQIDNKNYAFGAYWAGFKQRRNSEYYMFTHDSTIMRGKLTKDQFGIRPMTPFYWFNERHDSEPSYSYWSWAMQQLSLHANYPTKEGQCCIYAGIFTATNRFMEKLERDGLDKIKPTIKMEAVYADEFIWAVAAEANGLIIKDICYYGTANNILADDRLFWKYSGTLDKGRT